MSRELKRRKPRWLAACHRGSAMEGAEPSEMPRLLLSCVRDTVNRLVCVPRSSFIPRSSESRRSLPLKGDATPFRPTQSALGRTHSTHVEICGERERDMARKKSGKRGSAIIVLMVVAAIAGSPSTAAAATAKPQPLVSVPAQAPVLAVGLDFASWAEASWAEE